MAKIELNRNEIEVLETIPDTEKDLNYPVGDTRRYQNYLDGNLPEVNRIYTQAETKNPNRSVVQPWVSMIPFMQQALLFTAMRGPDGLPKYTAGKDVVRFLRGAVLLPASPSGSDPEYDPSSFMVHGYKCYPTRTDDYDPAEHHFWDRCTGEFLADNDAYPHHFIMHLVHAAEVIGYKHPDPRINYWWLTFYCNMCANFHMDAEIEAEMDLRMSK